MNNTVVTKRSLSFFFPFLSTYWVFFIFFIFSHRSLVFHSFHYWYTTTQYSQCTWCTSPTRSSMYKCTRYIRTYIHCETYTVYIIVTVSPQTTGVPDTPVILDRRVRRYQAVRVSLKFNIGATRVRVGLRKRSPTPSSLDHDVTWTKWIAFTDRAADNVRESKFVSISIYFNTIYCLSLQNSGVPKNIRCMPFEVASSFFRSRNYQINIGSKIIFQNYLFSES